MAFLILSAHDYRSPRKAGIHFVTAELAKLGTARFFSLHYSQLSKLKSDPRRSLDALANRKATTADGVECYLWRTLTHPFRVRNPRLSMLEAAMFRFYTARPSPVLVEWIQEADVVFFESGMAPVFFDQVRRLNPAARTVYIASDDLNSINAASFVKRTFERVAPSFDTICLKTRSMAAGVPHGPNLRVVPHGFDFSVDQHADPSPYPPGLHAVSLGSMLFDPEFFAVASKAYPDITFHVIGSGKGEQPGYGPNVRVYGEMPHRQTLPYIKHASFGIAPYRAASLPAHLGETSLKLMQYDHFKLPAVCPHAIVCDCSTRFGYEPGQPESIVNAIRQALVAPRVSTLQHLPWSEVVQRILNPEAYDDTRLDLAAGTSIAGSRAPQPHSEPDPCPMPSLLSMTATPVSAPPTA
jgi:2-beta-glucuronyltransferase